ncbi:hypothetical protein RIF29_31818 [Crotalaria pallida]|uniref:Carboxypeptidase n=1 Tax=Crotalaria pallida TaxID=3830 RepID=A0AAN9EIE0_CROPI
MASSILVKFSLTLLLFLILSSLSYSRQNFSITKQRLSQSLTISHNSKSQADRLIRSFNLFPNDPFNIIASDPGFILGSIVETEYSFLGDDRPSVKELGHHAGYYSLPHSKAARMFYFFFESRNSKDDPFVLFLFGGPGCSTEIAVFYENGPFKITNNLTLEWNEHGWDQAFNMLFVDQPTGTGFSYTTDEADIRHDETGVSNDLYDFLQEFFKEHPQFVKNDFYIAGESYSGHYIPALASRVNEGNKKKEGIPINLKGFAIGNGLTDPAIQYAAYGDFALDRGLITIEQRDSMNELLPDCEQAIKSCDSDGGDSCSAAYISCINVFNKMLSFLGDINVYDMRKQCNGPILCNNDLSNLEKFLNKGRVKDSLGVMRNLEFVLCNKTVYSAMIQDWMKNLVVGIPTLLEEGIRMLVYAGEEDLICNWLGNFRWVQAMEWSGQKDFNSAPTVKFSVDGKEAGLLTSHEPLSFLKVHEAGHLVPMDQPKVAFEMMRSWVAGKLA